LPCSSQNTRSDKSRPKRRALNAGSFNLTPKQAPTRQFI
jgi:hypothetical protein